MTSATREGQPADAGEQLSPIKSVICGAYAAAAMTTPREPGPQRRRTFERPNFDRSCAASSVLGLYSHLPDAYAVSMLVVEPSDIAHRHAQPATRRRRSVLVPRLD